MRIEMVRFIKKFRASEYGMKIRERFFPEPGVDRAARDLARAMKRFSECENKKKPSLIKRELQICKDYWNCYPHHYYIYDLFREDNHLTEEELINFIPHFYWNYLFLPYHNSRKFSLLGENKIMIDLFFRSLKISQPETLSILLNGNLYSPGMELVPFTRIHDEIMNSGHEKIFVKPADGSGGKGFHIFHKNDRNEYVTRQNIVFNENFLDAIGKNNDYIIQSGLTQDPEISRIYPESVNTCRIITENKNGVSRAVCAVLRLGRSQSEVDNASSGGIFLKIDSTSGKVGDQAMSYNYEKFKEHPDTHFIFRNYEIEHWDEIRKFVTDASGKFPFLSYLGWDIALTTDGPAAIEINRLPGISLMQMTSGGLREAFGINDPDYYWKNQGKRGEHL